MTGMRRLHLIRHAPVVVAFGVAAREWKLAPEAAGSLGPIAAALENAGLRRIVASREPKAAGTGGLLADRLGQPLETRDGLEEHHRLAAQQNRDTAAFHAQVRRFFVEPTALVFGAETAHAALARFRAAVSGVMDEAAGDGAIVAHGTVISLLLAAAGNGPAWEIWRSLRLPDHVVVDWPGLRRIEG